MFRVLVAAVIVLVSFRGSAEAQTTHRRTTALSVKGGMMFGLTPDRLRTDYETEYFVGGTAGFPVGSWTVVRPTVELGQLGFDVQQFLEENQRAETAIVSVTGGDYQTLLTSVDVLLGFHRPTMVAAYGILGVGYYRATTKDFTILTVEDVRTVSGQSNSGILLKGGGGVRADMNEQLGVFAEVELVYGVMETNHLVLPVAVGVYLNL